MLQLEVALLRGELDTYLTVAHALLNGDMPDAPASKAKVSAGGDQDRLTTWWQKRQPRAAPPRSTCSVCRARRTCRNNKPRGHYEDDPALQTYFRAMMWLGRIDLRLVETNDAGEQVLRRPQIDAMLLLHSLFGDTDRQRFHRVDDVVRAFVGEGDHMTLDQVPTLLTALGVQDAAGVAKIADDKLKQTILENGFGKQQIMSHLMLGGLDAPVPLNASFLLFGQRYIVDSHVLSNVVWDRVRQKRMMPDPLDVAFAALGNDQAASLLKSQIEQYDYAGDLAGMRTLVDAHDEEFWHKILSACPQRRSG